MTTRLRRRRRTVRYCATSIRLTRSPRCALAWMRRHERSALRQGPAAPGRRGDGSRPASGVRRRRAARTIPPAATVSPLRCASTAPRRIVEMAHEVSACILAQASASLLGAHLEGADETIRAAACGRGRCDASRRRRPRAALLGLFGAQRRRPVSQSPHLRAAADRCGAGCAEQGANHTSSARRRSC